MKVILFNGSPRANGNTNIALEEMVKVFKEEGIDTEILHIGNMNIRYYCKTEKYIVFIESHIYHPLTFIPNTYIIQ